MDDITRPYGYTFVTDSPNNSIFASLEATDSTSSLPYPSVLLQFVLEFTKVAKGLKLMALAEGISIRQYIDGWLMKTNSNSNAKDTLTGWCILLKPDLDKNLKKSHLFPTPLIEFMVTF